MASNELDLFNMIRHAYISGAQWKGATITEAIGGFIDYDPEKCHAYDRLCDALSVNVTDDCMDVVKYSPYDAQRNG